MAREYESIREERGVSMFWFCLVIFVNYERIYDGFQGVTGYFIITIRMK